MKLNYYSRFLTGVVAIAVVCVGLALATYTLQPGETAVLLGSGNRVESVKRQPGLYWKVPLLGSVVRVDGRTRLSMGTIRPRGGDAQGLGVGYALVWRVSDARVFYEKTANDPGTVQDRLTAALTPAVREAMGKADASRFLTQPSSALQDSMMSALKPAAQKIGITVIGVYPGTADIPDDLRASVVKTMTAGTTDEIAAAEKAGEAELNKIAATAAGKRAAVLSAAEQEAARIGGESQGKVAMIYAPAAAEAPAFFRYYLALESESAALKSHTKVFVISTDSPWFEALQAGGGKQR